MSPPQVCVLVAGFNHINYIAVIIMISHIIDSEYNEAGELYCVLVLFISLAVAYICTKLVGGSDTYNLEINVIEIELILDHIF